MIDLLHELRDAAKHDGGEYAFMLGWLLSQVERGDIKGAQESAEVWKRFQEDG